MVPAEDPKPTKTRTRKSRRDPEGVPIDRTWCDARCYASDFHSAACAVRKHRALHKDPGDIRRVNLRTMYKISPEEYDEMMRQQGSRCAICLRHESEIEDGSVGGRPRLDGKPKAVGMKLTVDHSHDTGAVRGLLCRRCNFGIGNFKDNPDTSARATEYLRQGGFRAATPLADL